MKHLITALIAILLASPAVADGLDAKFYGSYVGSGVAEDLEENMGSNIRSRTSAVIPTPLSSTRSFLWITPSTQI